ncbi:hypothetical protein BJ944DRAFT_273478 [Cunninghamella echinulata]|nr:hypothetical protein BJ944DRAFT_273478 [Cunninghamella echinulata]
MSTLNALGFSVRRKRNNDITTTKQQQLGKIIDAEPSKGNIATSLAFTSGPILEEEEEKIVLSYNKKTQQRSSIKLKQSSISKYTTKKTNNNKNNNQNNKNNKDPKQSSLLQFLSPTPNNNNNNNNNSNNNNNTEFVLPKMTESNNNDLVKLNEHHYHKDMINKKSEEASDEVSICSIRHPITISEVLPLLIDSFGVYDNINSNKEDDPLYTSSSSSSLLLQVKPNKKILSSSTLNDLENHMIHQDKLYTQGIRRSRRYYQEDDDEEQVEEMDDDDDSDDTNGSDLSLPSAFTKSMSLFPMKKRYCTNSDHNESATTRNKHHNLFKDLKEDYTQNEHDHYEKRDLRHSLSVDQVSSLLLNIANEFLAFEDNEWAVTYLQ